MITICFASAAGAGAEGNRAPVISGTPATSATAGRAYFFTVTASDPDGDPLSFRIVNRPSWATLSSTGRLSGTPPSGTVGQYRDIRISVNDGYLNSYLAPFSITVGQANHLPTIAGTPAAAVAVGQAYSFTPTASDPDGNALTFSIVNRPTWLSFNSSNGRLSGTPASTAAGSYIDIRISVSDGLASATLAPFSIVVGQGNLPPTIGGSPPTAAREGLAYAFRPNASDPNGDPLTFSIANRPVWAAFSNATGALTGTPGVGTVGSYANIRISVSDGRATTSLPAFSIAVVQTSLGSATLRWRAPTTRTDGRPLTNLAGYHVRYGTAARSYPNVVNLRNGGLTAAVISNLPPATYYFVVSAYDTTGAESANSAPVSKRIL